MVYQVYVAYTRVCVLYKVSCSGEMYNERIVVSNFILHSILRSIISDPDWCSASCVSFEEGGDVFDAYLCYKSCAPKIDGYNCMCDSTT